MRRHRIVRLPVVEQGRLAGIVTERDFMTIADHLLEDFLRGDEADAPSSPPELPSPADAGEVESAGACEGATEDRAVDPWRHQPPA